jgi:pimeloyl-ACP methyl ester carboxylesterase
VGVALLIAGLGLVVGLGYFAYAAWVGGEWVIHPDVKSADCRTPLFQYGWPYEAVGYDVADDARLEPRQVGEGEMRAWWCPSQGTATRDDIVTSDGLRIAGWYVPAASAIGPAGQTVLLVHGRSSNKSDFLRYAPPLHDAYNLLVIDLRNGGRSGGTETTMGVGEGRDVIAALDWLRAQKGTTWVAGVGVSLGGVALLQAAASSSWPRAIVLDSVHARLADSLADGVAWDRHLPGWPTGWAMTVGASVMLGFDISVADPARTIAALGKRPILFLHGTEDRYDIPARSVEENRRIAELAGVSTELHYCAKAGHAQVRDVCPEQWADWVTDFLARARRNDVGLD